MAVRPPPGGVTPILTPQKPDVASARAVAMAAATAPHRAIAKGRVYGTCTECGRVVAMRKISEQNRGPGVEPAGPPWTVDGNKTPTNSAMRHEITVRMSNGSTRVINHATAANWRPGEKIIVIDGATPSYK